jgi:hypothetical protein
MLYARADAGKNKACAKPHKPARQSHDQESGRRDEGRKGECRARAESCDDPVARDL